MTVIRSSDVSFDTVSWKELPEICAVDNEDLTRSHCVPNAVLSVDDYRKEKKKECPSFIRKYWFLLGLLVVTGLAYLFSDVGKSVGYIRAERSVKGGCVMFIFLSRWSFSANETIGQRIASYSSSSVYSSVQVRRHSLIGLRPYFTLDKVHCVQSNPFDWPVFWWCP